MAKKTKLESLVSEMSAEEVREAFLALLRDDQKLRDDFIAAHTKPADDLEDSELLEMVREKAEAIADAIEWKVRDEEEMWNIARAKYGSRYIECGDEFEAAVEDELLEARSYASQLAEKGHVRLALEFVRIADEEMTEALSHTDYDVETSGYSVTDLWRDVLDHADAKGRAVVLAALVSQAEESEDMNWELLGFLCNRAQPAVCGRILALLDAQIRKDREENRFRESLDLPYWVERRRRVMEVAGETPEAIEAFIGKTFEDCPFGQAAILKMAERREDLPAEIAACRKLLDFGKLPTDKRREFSSKLADLQEKSGDAAGELATLREAVRQEAAGLTELRRFREVAPADEWDKLLSGFVKAVTADSGAYPKTDDCASLLFDAGDKRRLWEIVRASPRKSVWIRYMETLAPDHADAYGDFLLAHIDDDDDGDGGYFFWRRRDDERAETKYGQWADAIRLVARIPGQEEKAMKKAEQYAKGRERSWTFRRVWLAKGLPGAKPYAKAVR